MYHFTAFWRVIVELTGTSLFLKAFCVQRGGHGFVLNMGLFSGKRVLH